jgi:hypothetical protein
MASENPQTYDPASRSDPVLPKSLNHHGWGLPCKDGSSNDETQSPFVMAPVFPGWLKYNTFLRMLKVFLIFQLPFHLSVLLGYLSESFVCVLPERVVGFDLLDTL